MAKVIVNLTVPIVKEEIDSLLAAYPDPSSRRTFENPDVYQELITYVLSRSPNFYTVIEAEAEATLKPAHLYPSLAQRIKIGTQVQQGIQQILQTSLDRAYSNSLMAKSL